MRDDYPTPLSPGDRLDRYELICPIASGGMASVWVGRMKGKHGFEKLVAIKTILPQYASDPRFRAMFVDEATILSRIQHVNVAQILDVGEEREVLYLVMEFVDGDALSKLLKTIFTKELPLPIGVVLRVLADAAVGLHAAHELRDKKTGALVGLVHRDVSPQNILVTPQGATKVIDFGIAKVTGRLTQETSAGSIKGKISYMAPEQASGKGVDRRADVWAIGAMLHAVYTGRTPYEGETELDTLHALASGKDPAPLAGDVPGPVREIVRRATRPNPEERYATALDLSRAIEGALGALGLLTSAADVGAFVATHMADRAVGREKALTFALKAAGDRERVRDMLAPERDDVASSDGLGGAAKRMLERGIGESVPPAAPVAAERPPRTRSFEGDGIGHAATALKSAPSPLELAEAPRSVPHAPTKIAEPPPPRSVGNVRPPSARGAAAAPMGDVPDLIVPSTTTRKPPPAALEPLPPSPFDMEDDLEGFIAPAPVIASAAGSILGPDVDARKAPLLSLALDSKRPPAPPAPFGELSALSSRPPPDAQPPTQGARPPMGNDDAQPTSGEFFDPTAIAAKRAAEPAQRRASGIALNHDAAPGGDFLGASRPARAIVADRQAELRRAREARQAPRRKWALFAGVAAAAAALVGMGLVAAPAYAKRQAIAAAEQQGVVLTVERATVGWGNAHLYGLTFAAASIPLVKASAASATLDLRGAEAETIVLQDPVFTVAGSVEEVDEALGTMATRASAATGRARKVTLQNARITWTGPLGLGSRVDAEGVGLDMNRVSANLGDDAHLTAPSVRVTTSRGVLGPWRIDGERTSKHIRARVVFDPVLADGPSAILVRGDQGTQATLKITRQPLARLGIPYAFLGLVADETTQVEGSAQVTRPLPNRLIGDVAFTVFDARLTPASPRLELSLKGSFAGDPAGPMETARTQLAFGPLIASALGAVTVTDDAFRVDLKWSLPPLPCGVLTKKASGERAQAAGMILFDSRRPDQAEFKLTQASTCGMAIFPAH